MKFTLLIALALVTGPYSFAETITKKDLKKVVSRCGYELAQDLFSQVKDLSDCDYRRIISKPEVVITTTEGIEKVNLKFFTPTVTTCCNTCGETTTKTFDISFNPLLVYFSFYDSKILPSLEDGVKPSVTLKAEVELPYISMNVKHVTPGFDAFGRANHDFDLVQKYQIISPAETDLSTVVLMNSETKALSKFKIDLKAYEACLRDGLKELSQE